MNLTKPANEMTGSNQFIQVGPEAEPVTATLTTGEYVQRDEETDSILWEALEVTRQSRQQEYAHPMINFMRTGELWTTYLRPKMKPGSWITPVDVAWMMVLMKTARAMKTHKRDNVVDTAGYADCIGRIDDYMKQLGYSGVEAFQTMTAEEALTLAISLETEELK